MRDMRRPTHPAFPDSATRLTLEVWPPDPDRFSLVLVTAPWVRLGPQWAALFDRLAARIERFELFFVEWGRDPFPRVELPTLRLPFILAVYGPTPFWLASDLPAGRLDDPDRLAYLLAAEVEGVAAHLTDPDGLSDLAAASDLPARLVRADGLRIDHV